MCISSFTPKSTAATDMCSVFLSVLKDQNGLSNFSNKLSKCSRNPLYHHHQNTLKPCCTTISDSDKVVAVSQSVFAVSKVKPLKNTFSPNVFYVANDKVCLFHATAMNLSCMCITFTGR